MVFCYTYFMEYKKAAEVLVKMLKNPKLTAEEKQALAVAIGWLGWAYLYQNRIKSIRAKRKKNN